MQIQQFPSLIIMNSLQMESARSSFMESVASLTIVLILTTRARLNRAINSRVWARVDTGTNAISVTTLRFVQTSCGKNAKKGSTAPFVTFTKAAPTLTWAFVSMERLAGSSISFESYAGIICTAFARKEPNALIIILKYLCNKTSKVLNYCLNSFRRAILNITSVTIALKSDIR